jgi:hypothetical protein
MLYVSQPHIYEPDVKKNGYRNDARVISSLFEYK